MHDSGTKTGNLASNDDCNLVNFDLRTLPRFWFTLVGSREPRNDDGPSAMASLRSSQLPPQQDRVPVCPFTPPGSTRLQLRRYFGFGFPFSPPAHHPILFLLSHLSMPGNSPPARPIFYYGMARQKRGHAQVLIDLSPTKEEKRKKKEERHS